MRRVVSFLPAGTEIAFAIGAGPAVVGRSHECDYPPDVQALPVVSRPALELEGLSQDEIDAAVAERLRNSGSLYVVDEELLRELAPDVILTQDLCQVCAPSGNELTRALKELRRQPEVVWLTPRTIEEIYENIIAVGRATDRVEAAESLVKESRTRLKRLAERLEWVQPKRVVFLEWTEPFFSAGHWVPEMITLAGGDDPLGNAGADSERITWDHVIAAQPEVLIVAPCGYGLDRAKELARRLPTLERAEVYAVDANAYFARPGPRVVDGVELLAGLFHPKAAGSAVEAKAVRVALVFSP